MGNRQLARASREVSALHLQVDSRVSIMAMTVVLVLIWVHIPSADRAQLLELLKTVATLACR